MKKIISILMAIIIAISALSLCMPAFAQEIAENDISAVNEKVLQMCEKYNEEYEEKIDDADVSSITIDNRIIVETKSKINTYDAVDEVYGLGYAFIQFENEKEAEEALNQYKKQGLTVQNDKLYNLNTVSTNAEGSDWAYTFSEANVALDYFKSMDNPEIIVGIIDSGIDLNHTKLQNRIIRSYTNFASSTSENSEMDNNGHGTNVAGVIAQSTPDNVKISAFKVSDVENKVYTSSLICAYEYILAMKENRPDIINMSYGGNGLDTPVERDLLSQLKDSGITLVASAGNDNIDTKDVSPANNINVLAVSAHDENGNKCWFSNYGSTVDIAAPGQNVKTYTVGNSNSYEYVNGTSFSAPFVCAAAAYVLMQNETLKPDEVYEKMKLSAFDRKKPTDKKWAGSGLLNFSNLIENNDRKSNVVFNYASGSYNETIKVELSCEDMVDTKIIYTTNNTLPSPDNGSIYQTAIEVDSQAIIIAAAFPISGSAMHSEYAIGNYQIFRNADESDFKITNDGEITAYNGNYVAIKVPDTINGISPTKIGKECFKDSNIVNIELPNTVTEIGENAFEGSSLERIVGYGVTLCESYAFNKCYSLYEEHMPNITELYQATFCDCSLLTELSFADNLVYADCYNDLNSSTGCLSGTGITEAVFPNLIYCCRAFENTPITYASLPKVTYLNGAFKDCKLLEDVNIPNVTKIDRYAFANCISLPKEMDFTKITDVDDYGFAYAPFEKLYLPNLTEAGQGAFYYAKSKTIDIPNCKSISLYCFAGSDLELVNIENVENTIGQYYIFLNCFSLKYIYAPKLKTIPAFGADEVGKYELSQGVVPALEFIYIPKAMAPLPGVVSELHLKEFLNLKFIFAPELVDLGVSTELPAKDDFTLFLSEKFQVSPLGVNGKYTVVAPKGSYAESWATDKNAYYNFPDGLNFVPSDYRDESTEEPANVTDLGRSICSSVAGLRFGFTWNNLDEIENLATHIEYGFIYSQKGVEDLSVETVDGVNVRQTEAVNRVDNGENTSFNLVISNIPNAYIDREITARAYVCIDGMYFYSNIQRGSFSEVANLVLADDEIDQNTKNAVKNLLEV